MKMVVQILAGAGLLACGIGIGVSLQRDKVRSAPPRSRAKEEIRITEPAATPDEALPEHTGNTQGSEKPMEGASAERAPHNIPARKTARPPSRELMALLDQLVQPGIRTDAKALAALLRKLAEHREAILADPAALDQLLEVLQDRESPLTQTGAEWKRLLEGADDPRVAEITGHRLVGIDEGDPFPHASDLRAVIELHLAQLGPKRDGAVLSLLARYGKKSGSTFVHELLNALEGEAGPQAEARIVELLDGGYAVPAFKALSRLDNPAGHEQAFALVKNSPDKVFWAAGSYGPRLTSEQADQLRKAFRGNPRSEVVYLKVLAEAPPTVQVSQAKAAPLMMMRLLRESRESGDRKVYGAVVLAAYACSLVIGDEAFLEFLRAEQEKTEQRKMKRVLGAAAQRVERRLD